MHILMITENDPAGTGIAFTQAVNRHTQHQCRLITTTTRYNFNFKKDLHTSDLNDRQYQEIVDLLERADIIHFHILADENIQLGPLKVKDYIRNKALLHHHHGHPDFRANPEKYREKYRRLRRKVLVSTPDLLHLMPEARWQPNLVPIHDPMYQPQPVSVNGSIVIGQSATRKDLKNTQELMETVASLQKRHVNPRVQLDIIENTDHCECLRRKSRCHIVFDHMQGYYGVSSLESLSQGKPVIAGLDDWNLSHIKAFTGALRVPWIICRTKDRLKEILSELCRNTVLIQEVGYRSRRFMCRYWSDRQIVNRLVEMYQTL